MSTVQDEIDQHLANMRQIEAEAQRIVAAMRVATAKPAPRPCFLCRLLGRA